MQQLSKSSLSSSQARLIETMQQLGFGTIERLVIRDGEPVFDDPPPRILRDLKLGGENGPRPEADLDDFILKAQVRDLLEHIESLSNGTIHRLEVKHGLPFRMEIAEATG